MRTGPGSTYAIVTTLDSGTGVILEARNADTSWVLGRTENGTYRGWLASLYLSYRDGFTPASLPVSDEIVSAPAITNQPAAPSPNPANPAPAISGGQEGGEMSGTITATLNIRQGPGQGYAVVGQFAANRPVILEGRDGSAAWVLARSPDGSARGWVKVLCYNQRVYGHGLLPAPLTASA
jgi:uncharacterized protein YraI